MAKMYLPVIAPKDYEAFRKILRDEIPSNYAEWRRDVDKWQAVRRAQQDTIIEVEISPNSFANYLRQNDYAPGLKRLVGFAADQGEVIAGSGRGLGPGQEAVTNDRPWRLTDLTFVLAGDGRDRATINGVEVIRENGRYWIITPSGLSGAILMSAGSIPPCSICSGKSSSRSSRANENDAGALFLPLGG
jgi:hypothetical protein